MKIKSAGEVRGMDRCETPREKTCCFTGHRSSKLPWGANESDPRCIRLKASLADAVEAVYAEGVRHFICGMAEGCDTFFGEAVAELLTRGCTEHCDIGRFSPMRLYGEN